MQVTALRLITRAPRLVRTYANHPDTQEAGKRQAEKAKSGTQEVDTDHHTSSESAAKHEHSKKSIEELQKETEKKVCILQETGMRILMTSIHRAVDRFNQSINKHHSSLNFARMRCEIVDRDDDVVDVTLTLDPRLDPSYTLLSSDSYPGFSSGTVNPSDPAEVSRIRACKCIALDSFMYVIVLADCVTAG